MLDGGLAPLELGEPAVAEEALGLAVDVERRHRVAEARVVAQPLPVGALRVAQLHQRLDPRSTLATLPIHNIPRSWRERPLCHRPTAVEPTHQVLGRHLDVGEEHLVEVARSPAR